MYFHTFRPSEMKSPAAQEESNKVSRQRNEHRFLRDHTGTHLQHGRTDFLAQLDRGLEQSLRPATRPSSETRAGAKRRSKREKKMLREHARAVHAELQDVMTRASDTMRERIRNGAPGGMYVSAFLTPMQQKLRAGQLAYEREVGMASAHYDYGGANREGGGGRLPVHPRVPAHAGMSSAGGWVGDDGGVDSVEATGRTSAESRVALEKGGPAMSSDRDDKPPSKSMLEAFAGLQDLALGGGPSALQWLALRDPHKFGKQLQKVLMASTLIHGDTQTSLQAICQICEERSTWLTQADRARLFIYEPEPVTTVDTAAALSTSRVVCFRRDGQSGTLDLGSGASRDGRGKNTGGSSGLDFAFAGLLPKHSRMHENLFDAIVEAAESGEPICLYLGGEKKKKKRRKKRKSARSSRLKEFAGDSITWCFPIINRADSRGGSRPSASRTIGILVVTNAKNRALEKGAAKQILKQQQKIENQGALSIADIDGKNNHDESTSALSSSSSSSSSDSDGDYSPSRRSSSRRRKAEASFASDEVIFSQFLQNVAVALCNINAREHLISQYRLKLDLEIARQSDAAAQATTSAKRLQQEADERAQRIQLDFAQRQKDETERAKQVELAFTKREEKLQLELEKALARVAEDERLIKLREDELINFDSAREVEAAKQLVEQAADNEAMAAEKARVEAEMSRLKAEHEALLATEQNEHQALSETEAALAAAKADLEKQRSELEVQQQSQREEARRLSISMSEKHHAEMVAQKAEDQRVMDEQRAKLEADVRRHEAEVRRQKKRVDGAKAAAARSSDRLPSALNALRKMSQIAMGEHEGEGASAASVADQKQRASELLAAIVDTTINVLEAERATLFLVSQDGTHLWSEHMADAHASPDATPPPSPSRGGDHVGNASPASPEKPAFRIVIDRTAGICGHVATTRQLYNIEDVYDDIRFDSSWDKKTGFRTRSMLVAPVLNAKGDVLGVIQAMNKMHLGPTLDDVEDDEDDEGATRKKSYPTFKTEDEQIIRMLCSHAAMGIEHSRGLHKDAEALSNAKRTLEATQEKMARHDNDAAMLLDAARDVAVSSADCYNRIDALMMNDEFDEEDDDDDSAPKVRSLMVPMFERVVAHARRLCKADRASLFFADWEGHRLWSVVAEGVTTAASTTRRRRGNAKKKGVASSPSSALIELPMGRGVVGRCVETGKPIVTQDARSLPYFDDTHDMSSGYHTQSIICVPVFGHKSGEWGGGNANGNKRKTKKKSNGRKSNNGKGGGNGSISEEPKQVVIAALMIINKLDATGHGCITDPFSDHDVDLAKTLSVQVSGPVLHAQDLMRTVKGKHGLSKKRREEMMEKIASVEQKGTQALQEIESQLKTKVHDVSSRAARMMEVLQQANQHLMPGMGDHGDDSRDVSALLSHVLDEVRSVLGAISVIFYEQDHERRLLWPRARSVSEGKSDGAAAKLLGKFALSAGQGGTTSLAPSGGGNLASAGVAVAVAASNSAAGLEASRRACALSGERQGQLLGGPDGGLESLCLPVHGRTQSGRKVVLGILEAIVARGDDGTGSDAESTDSQFLASVSAQVGAVLGEESQAKTRAAGEEQAARALKQLQDQLASVKKDEAATGERLEKEGRLMKASAALNKSTKFRAGKHGAIVDLFGRTVSAATNLVGADRGSLFLVDTDKGMLRTTDTTESVAEGALVDDDTPVDFIEIPIKSTSIAGHVALSGNESNIVDAYKDPRFNSSIDRKSGYRTQSMLTVPVYGTVQESAGSRTASRAGKGKKKKGLKARRHSFSKDDGMQVIAILQLINKIAPIKGNTSKSPFTAFTDVDCELVQRFVKQASPAIRNALASDAQAEEVASAHAHLRDIEEQIEQERIQAEKKAAAMAEAKAASDAAAKENAAKAEKVLQVVVEKNGKLEASLISLRAESHRLRDLEKDLRARCKELERDLENLKESNAKSMTQMERAHKDKCKALRDAHRNVTKEMERLHTDERAKLEREQEALRESHRNQRREAEEEQRTLRQKLDREKSAMRDSNEKEVGEYVAKVQRDHAEEFQRLKKRAERDLAHAKTVASRLQKDADARIEELREANSSLLAKVSLLESRQVGVSDIYAGPTGLSSSKARKLKVKAGGHAKPQWDSDYAVSETGSEYSERASDSRMRRRMKKNSHKKKLSSVPLTKKKKKKKKTKAAEVKSKKANKKLVVTLDSTSPSRRGNVLLNFGVQSKSGKVQNYAVSASKTKKVKKKTGTATKKKKTIATLSAGKKGQVTIVVDKSLFTSRTNTRTVKHPTPPRSRGVDRSPKLYSADVSRLEYGFGPPPTSR